MRNHSGTAHRWTDEQLEALRAAGFSVGRSLDRFTGKQIGTDEVRVIRGSQEHTRLLNLFATLGVSPAERIQSRGMPRSVREYEFYAIDFGAPSDGFEGSELFLDQFDCAQPPPEGPAPGLRGCGLDKPQVRDLRLIQPKKVRRADIFQVWTPPYCENWRLLVVTRRLYDAIIEVGATGVEFRSVTLASNTSAGEATADYMQLIVTGRAAPVPLAGVERDNVCAKCRRSNGTELRTIDSFRWNRDWLQPVDIQVAERYVLPDGQVIRKKGSDQIIVSSKMVELLMKHGRGLTFRGANACAGPLYLF